MIRVLFVCHGNICRSPMAEFVMRDMVAKKGISGAIQVASAATSTEEIGNPVHPGTKKILHAHGITTQGKCAIQLTSSDADRYDYFVGMDHQNTRNMMRILGHGVAYKIHLLLTFCRETRDIADPWYTGDFQQTYRDVSKGCEALLTYLIEHHPTQTN